MFVYRTKCALYKTKAQQREEEDVKVNILYSNAHVKNMTCDQFITTVKMCNYIPLKIIAHEVHFVH